MKKLLILATTILTINGYSQNNEKSKTEDTFSNTKVVSETTTFPKVSYVSEDKEKRNPAYYINGELVNENLLKTMNPNDIVNIDVVNGDVEIDHKKYCGKIYIKTKEDFDPMLISLNGLKSKYTNVKNSSVIFMIDNEIIHDNYDTYLVDERYILKIVVEKIEMEDQKLKFDLIKLLTKTKANIEKSKEIHIRGTNKFEG